MNAADEVYQEKQTAVYRLLTNLAKLTTAHGKQQAQQPSDWGYVADLAHVEEQLKEVVGFLRPMESAECGL